MSKSIRRNYRNKISDSDEESGNSRGNVYVQEKVPSESRCMLSFGDELDDIESFKEKKASHIKKPVAKVKEAKKKPTRIPIEPDPSDISICVQNNLNVRARSPSPMVSNEFIHCEDRSSSITSMIQKGDIPDAAAIDLAKKQRGLAARRQTKNSDTSDDESEQYHTYSKKNNSSIEADLNIDDNERIVMVGKKNIAEKDRKMIRDCFLSVEHGSDRDSDQENEWENRQMQNAINKSVVHYKDSKKIDWQQNKSHENDEILPVESFVLNEINSIGLDEISVVKFTELLQQRRDEIVLSKAKNAESIHLKQRKLSEDEEKAKVAQKKLPQLEIKYNTFNNLKKFIAILSECFDEKMEKINYLENKFLKLFKERADKLIRRNRQDVQDQFDEIILSTKSSAIQSTYDMTMRVSRISDSESRRLRRIRSRETMNVTNHYEGLSSDDEEPKSTISSRQNEIDQINIESNQLFSDSHEDYCTIPAILEKFVAVREEFPDEYSDAFINGFLPHIIGPLVRTELITWNPLETPRFDKWKWFRTLVEYTKSNVGNQPIEDETSLAFSDLKLIPTIFDKSIVPKLIDWISIWNPMSKIETQNLVKFIGKLISQIPTFNDKSIHVKNLLRAIACRVNECIAEDITIPLYIEQYKENLNGLAFQFFQRQTWSVIKTFSNIMMFHEIMDPVLLTKLALQGILNNYIITGLIIFSELGQVNDIVIRMNMIKHSFPESWIGGFSESQLDINEELGNLIRFINNFGYTNRKDKSVVNFAFSTLDYFKVSRTELLSMLNS